jgi:hypothetical protein
MNTPPLTPLQKASVCVAAAGDANVSEMLEACQFIMGQYSLLKGEGSTRLKDKIDNKFTPSRNLGLSPTQKFSLGGEKGLDFASLQRLLPRTKTKPLKPIATLSEKKPTPNYTQNTNGFKPQQNTTSFRANVPNTNRTTSDSSQKPYQQPPQQPPQPPVNKQPYNTKKELPPKPELPAKRKVMEDEEREEPPDKQDPFTTAKEKYVGWEGVN